MMFRLLALYVVLLPFETLGEWIIGRESELKPYRLAGILLAFAWLLRAFMLRRRPRLDAYDAVFVTLLVLGVALTAFWNMAGGNVDVGIAVHKTILLSFPLIVYLVMKNLTLSQAQLERLMSFFLYSVCASVLLAFLLGMETVSGRFVAFSGQSNRLGLAIAIAIHIVIAKTLGTKRGTSMTIYLARAVLLLGLIAALLFSGSRGSMLALAFSLPLHAVALVGRSGRRRGTAARLASLAPVVLVCGILVAGVLGRYGEEASGLRRLLEPPSDATTGRYDIWRSAWTASVDYYFLGMGTGQYRAQHREYVSQLETLRNPKTKEHDLETHNELLNVLTSYGLVGVIMYLWMFVSLFRRLLSWTRTAGPDGWLPIALLPLLGHVFVGGITAVLIHSPPFFLVIGIMTYVVRRAPSVRRTSARWSDRLSAAEIARRVPARTPRPFVGSSRT